MASGELTDETAGHLAAAIYIILRLGGRKDVEFNLVCEPRLRCLESRRGSHTDRSGSIHGGIRATFYTGGMGMGIQLSMFDERMA